MSDKLSYKYKDENEQDEILALLKEIQQGQKAVIVLSEDEVKELKQWLSDKKALGRVYSILKTGLITTAGIILAWNVFFDNIIKNGLGIISGYFGGGH